RQGSQRWQLRARDHAVVQRLPPGWLEISRQLAVPGAAHQLVAGALAVAEQDRHHLLQALAAVERLDQRLDETRRAVEGACVAPALELVGGRGVPVAVLGRLVPA